MQAVTTIGLDIAKSVFQVHGIDAEGKVLIRRQLKRRYVLTFFEKLPPCLVGIEACGRMAWAMMAKGERYKEPVALAA
jgi:transposase